MTSNGIDEEPSGRSEASSEENSAGKRSGAYQKLRRDLSEDELLNNPGAQKMLLSDLDRLENEVVSLKNYKDLYHKADKQCAIKDEQLKTSNAHEILFAVTISLGATLIGLSPSLWTTDNALKINFGVILLGAGLILTIVGILTKFLARK